jgi:hypothetical protein
VRLIAAAIVAGALAASAAGASAATDAPPSKLLWATIDECAGGPSGELVGVRGSMPGTGNQNEKMLMLFSLQYRAPKMKHWHSLGASALVDAGSAAYASRQAGFDFHLAAGATARTVLRGVVRFEWRSGSSIVQSALATTTAGRAPSAGAHPPGFSAARCRIS